MAGKCFEDEKGTTYATQDRAGIPTSCVPHTTTCKHNGLRCLYLVIIHGEMLLRAWGKGGKVCLKSHFTVQCGTGGLAAEEDSRTFLASSAWAPCACVLAEDAPSRVVKCPSPPQWSCFCTLESPTLPKAQANSTKTQVMVRQGFLHLISACLHHASVKPWVYGSPCSWRGLAGQLFSSHTGHQHFNYKRWRARKSSGNARCRIAIITHKRLQDFTHYTNSTEACIRLIIPGLWR